MWYKIAAFGTIDLQKYIGEKEGEDFDFESELQTLLKSHSIINRQHLQQTASSP